MEIDSRLVGETSENMFLSLMNQQGVFAHSFDTIAFDGIDFDLRNKYLKVGTSPFFLYGSNAEDPRQKNILPWDTLVP